MKNTQTNFQVGYQKDETNVRFVVVGAPEAHHVDEGGSLNSRAAAVKEAKERARRCGGTYVGDLDRAREFGAAHAFDLDPTTLVIDSRGGITPEVDNPPARYRATVGGEKQWFKSGSDAVDYIERQRNWASNLPSSIYDEWAGHTVSDADAICEFPRLTGPKV